LVQGRRGALKDCYDAELAGNPALTGLIRATWTIAQDGSVSQAAAAEDTIGVPRMTTCVLDRIREIQFPRPSSGTCVIVWPFRFTPQPRAPVDDGAEG